MNKEEKKAEAVRTTSCGAVVWRTCPREGEQILLIKQFSNRDSWGIPKGHMDLGETLEQCAMREVKEETGVSIRLGRRLPDVLTVLHNEHKTVVSYIATVDGSHETNHTGPLSEVADAKWWNVESLPKIHLYQHALVERALELLQSRGEETLQEELVLDAIVYVHSYFRSVSKWSEISYELRKVPGVLGVFTGEVERKSVERWEKLTGRRVVFTG